MQNTEVETALRNVFDNLLDRLSLVSKVSVQSEFLPTWLDGKKLCSYEQIWYLVHEVFGYEDTSGIIDKTSEWDEPTI